MKPYIKQLAIVIIGIQSYSLSAQGCSDAGFCSVGNPFKEANKDVKNQIELGAGFGAGEEGTTIISSFVSYTRVFSDKFGMNAKFTGQSASGDFGTRANVGDVFLTGNYKFNPNSDKAKWSGLLGVKIPLTGGNDKINEVSLPMPYQSSLGTFDIIAGIEASLKKFEFNLATQIPLNDNKNSYLSTLAPTDKFVSTNFFHRQPDVLLRGTYKILLANEKLSLKPNVLCIYHVGNDSYLDQFNKRVIIANSEGLTVNGNVIANYKLGDNSSIETSIAAPFVIREKRPDGLTRAFTFGVSYKQGF